jgi:MFS family permease
MVPATVCSKLFPPRIWIALATIGWGLCSTLMVTFFSCFFWECILDWLSQATAFDFGGLLTARIGLGIFEAGFSAVAVLYLSELPFTCCYG